jgi:uncharacterized cupredoxin-like copper-binding protein
VALAVALVALSVALGRTTTGRPLPLSARSTSQSPTAAVQPFGAGDVPITLADYKAGVPATSLTAGIKNLQIANNGTVQHELLVFRPEASVNPASLPVGPDGDVNEDAPGVNKVSDGDNIDPGKSQTRQLDLTQPGTYVFICNLPGHYKLGMWTIVTVH